MGQTPDDVRHEIEETRRDMDRTLGELEDRVSPRRIAQRRSDRIRQAVGGARDRVFGGGQRGGNGERAAGQAREAGSSAADSMRQAPDAARQRMQGNPLAVGVIAFGGGLLAASLLPRTETEQEAAADLRERAQPLADELADTGREVGEHVKETARDAARETKETATDAARDAKEQASSDQRARG